MLKSNFLMVLLMIFAGGCTCYVRPVSAVPENENNENNVTILRNYNYVSGGLRFWPTVDGKEVSGLFSNTHISFMLSPGKHVIGVRCCSSQDQLDVVIQEYDYRYFKLSPSWNPFKGAEIEEITKEEAIYRLEKSTRIKTGHMSDCERKSVLYENNPVLTCFPWDL